MLKFQKRLKGNFDRLTISLASDFDKMIGTEFGFHTVLDTLSIYAIGIRGWRFNERSKNMGMT